MRPPPAPWMCPSCVRRSLATTPRPLQPTAPYSTAPIQSSTRRPIQLAIIGSGPAGFYSAYRLLKRLPDARITMFEKLPVPYGLARYGVAPDHPEVKKCTETLETVARESPTNFHFAGNVPIGDGAGELPLAALVPHFDGLLFAHGASTDRRLGIPGEELSGVLSARDFVGWYNGLPALTPWALDLASVGETAVVIGQGNVALDVTRILLSPLAELRKTDINEETLEALSRSRIREVKVIGRRGPLQAPYTIKELRELMQLPGVGFAPPPESWDALMQVPRKQLPRQLKRIAELLEKGSPTPLTPESKAWQLGYQRSPTAFLSQNGRDLDAVGFETTAYSTPLASLLTSGDPQANLIALRAAKVHPTNVDKTLIHAGLAFRSVGYQSTPLPGLNEIGVPFDTTRHVIPNDGFGRVVSAPSPVHSSPERTGEGLRAQDVAASLPRTTTVDAAAATGSGLGKGGIVPGVYVAGWVKRGATGVIASTLEDAFAGADVLAGDWAAGAAFLSSSSGEGHGGGGETGRQRGWEGVSGEISARGIRAVGWRGWEVIDAEERRRGVGRGKVREKMRSVTEMLEVLDR
ncbi:NADPH-adrenodoxin reductase [Teratosphaeriaceae sp. CCFEE 6253]|nr:NADPH-adrenodoxin reductase [Teratosphaeriaceae sp. CCFEE 6253]